MFCCATCGILVVSSVIFRYLFGYFFTSRAAPKHRIGFADESCAKKGFSQKSLPEKIDAIVIGSGLGGLSTAALLAKRGNKVVVFEQHDVAGGCTHIFTETSKKTQKKYEFDTGLHYVGGMKQGKPERKFMDLITDGGVDWHRMDNSYDVAINIKTGLTVPMASGRKALKAELLKAFPKEEKAIDEYFKLMKKISGALQTYFMLSFVPTFIRSFVLKSFKLKYFEYASQTTLEALQKITSNQDLIGVLTYLWGDVGLPPSQSSLIHHMMIASHYMSGSYYPIGGSGQLAACIVPVIEKNGGKVFVRAPVESILIDEKTNSVKGVRVKGVDVFAPIVVSNVGTLGTVTKLIPENLRQKYFSKVLSDLKANNIFASPSLSSVFVGISEHISLPSQNFWMFDSWDHDLSFKNMLEDSLNPNTFFISFPSAKDPVWNERYPGTSVAVVILPTSYEPFSKWENARVKHRGEDYEALKKTLEERALKVFLDKFPELKDKIDFVDVGSPLTNNYYLGTQRGESYGIAGTPTRWTHPDFQAATPISGLYLCGQDSFSPGIVGTLMSSLATAQTIQKSIWLDVIVGMFQ